MKKILPLALIVLGLMLLSGCLFIPAFNPTISGKDVSDKVGGPSSNKPLRVGKVTMNQVIALLGLPQYASFDGRRIAYTWEVLNGEWILPLCFTTQSQLGGRALELTFNDQNMLVDYQVSKVDGSLQLYYPVRAPSAVSQDLKIIYSQMPFHLPATKSTQPASTEKTP